MTVSGGIHALLEFLGWLNQKHGVNKLLLKKIISISVIAPFIINSHSLRRFLSGTKADKRLIFSYASTAIF